MDTVTLAKELISANGKNEAAAILSNAKNVSAIELAYAIKDKCYESWTHEPTLAQKASVALQVLSTARNEPEIAHVAKWIRGISEITEGKLDEALTSFRKAHSGFLEIGKRHQAAQTQVAKLIPLGLLGDYERAVTVGKEALSTFESLEDEVAAGKIEINLSNIASRQGRHREAKDFCASAVRRFLKLGSTEWLVMAQNDLANTLAELNEFEEAQERYESAIEIAREKEMHLTEAEILASLGNLQTYRGRYGDAVRYLEMSRQKFEQLEMPHQTAIADLEIAEIYQTLNLTTEAFDIYSRVINSLSEFKMRSEEARSRSNFGKLALLNGDYEIALKELKKAVDLFEQEENPAGTASAILLQARLEATEGSHKEALELVQKASKLLKKGQFPRLELEAGQLRGESLRHLHRLDQSIEILTENVKRATGSEQHNLAASGLVSLAKIALFQKNLEIAEKHLKASVEIVEHLRDPIPAEEFRMTFLADKLAPYELLAETFLMQNKIDDAFLYSERARSRSLLDILGATKGEQSQIGAEYERLRERLNWFYSRLSFDESEDAFANKEIARIEQELANIKMRESSLAQEAENTSSHNKSDNLLDELKAKLGTNRAILEFTRNSNGISAFFVDGIEVKYFENIAQESDVIKLLEGLRFQFETMRYGNTRLEKFEDQLKARATTYLERLYELLLAPVEHVINKKDLIIVPVASLFYVPFHALHDGEQHLIENRQIVTSPSSAVWNKLRDWTEDTLQNALVMSFADERIPLVEQEAAAVANYFEQSRTLSGKDARIENYFELSPGCDVVHIACHGEFRPDSPMYSNLKLADGFITVRDISESRLNANLVTLSACETGLNKIFAGDEIIGLARGFLSAGARNIAMTLWTVNDAVAMELMERFYDGIKEGSGIAKAMQIAQCELIKAGKHPYFWAPFVIIGQ